MENEKIASLKEQERIKKYKELINFKELDKRRSEVELENLIAEKSNLNKIQINLLVSSLDKSKLNDYLMKLPLMQQLKFATILRKFSEEVRELSRGKISSLEGKEGYKIRTYDEAEILKKRKMED